MSNNQCLWNGRRPAFSAAIFVSLAAVLSCDANAQSPAAPPAAGTGGAAQQGAASSKVEKVIGGNRLRNADFRQALAQWEPTSWGKKSSVEVDRGERYEGKPALRVSNLEFAHTFVRQVFTGKAKTRYRLSGYIKTKDVEVVSGKKSGAVLMVGRLGVNTPLMEGTNPWTKVTVDFVTTDDKEIRVGPSLGTDAVFVKGTAWFSDLKLVELGGE